MAISSLMKGSQFTKEHPTGDFRKIEWPSSKKWQEPVWSLRLQENVPILLAYFYRTGFYDWLILPSVDPGTKSTKENCSISGLVSRFSLFLERCNHFFFLPKANKTPFSHFDHEYDFPHCKQAFHKPRQGSQEHERRSNRHNLQSGDDFAFSGLSWPFHLTS